MRYDLVDLRLFLHVVDAGSITAGAAAVHLSLPSASARVRALETTAGVALLVRGRRGVRPTPAGTALARHARDLLHRAARMEGAVAGYARTATLPLTLLANTSALYGIVPRALTTFLAEYPDVDVTVAERRAVDTVEQLADGAADVGIALADTAAAAGMAYEPLVPDPLVVAGQVGGVLAGVGSMTWREVAEHPLVGLTESASLHHAIEGHLGPDAPLARYRTRADLGTVVALAAEGVGLAVVPLTAVEAAAGAGVRVQTCPLHEPWARRVLALCRGVGTAGGSSAAATVDALAAHIRAVCLPSAQP